jgi:hypothetical protein
MCERADDRTVPRMRHYRAGVRKDLSVWCRFTYHHIRRHAKVGAIQGWPECYQPANRPSRQYINHALYKILMILKCCAESHNDKRVGMIARPRRLPRLRPGRIVAGVGRPARQWQVAQLIYAQVKKSIGAGSCCGSCI